MAMTTRYVLVMICLFLCTLSAGIFLLSSLGKFNDWYPTVFTIRTTEVKEQFPLDFGPSNALMGFALIMNCVLVESKFIYLLKYEKDFKMFSSVYYGFWIVRILSSMPWSFLYSTEKVATSSLAMLIIFIPTCFSFVHCLQRRKQMDNENMTESAKFYFDWCVLELHAAYYVWYSHSCSFWGTVALVYKDGPAIELGGADNLRGWFSVEDAGTICIMFFTAAVLVWVVADLFLFHHYTKHVKLFYPYVILASITIVGRHIYVGKDMNRNNAIYLALGILAIIAWINRGPVTQKKGENGVKME